MKCPVLFWNCLTKEKSGIVQVLKFCIDNDQVHNQIIFFTGP